MRASIIAVGSELLGVDRIDTNSLRLASMLTRYGVELRRKSVIGDSEDELAHELQSESASSDLVLVTGGLGPTADDVTREAIAAAFDRPLQLRPHLVSAMEERFERAGLEMPEVNRRQAQVPSGAAPIANRRGTAPGLLLVENGCTLIFFPGVPHELEGMMDEALEPWLQSHTAGSAFERRGLRIACLPESRVEELIAPAYEEFGRQTITVLASPAEIRVLVTAEGDRPSRAARLEKMISRLAALVGEAVFTLDEHASLEQVVGEQLIFRGWTVATAESCTGGLVAERLTRVAGSSRYFVGGVVAYTNELKEELLGVTPQELEAHGAVSPQVACALADGARSRLGSDCGIGITGIAGPDGGSEHKPVGTVDIAIAVDGLETLHHRGRFPGERQRIRLLASQWALDLLRKQLQAVER